MASRGHDSSHAGPAGGASAGDARAGDGQAGSSSPLPVPVAAAWRPRVRPDLDVSLQRQAGRDMVVVRDSSRRRYFRFAPLGHDILGLLDGNRTLAEVGAALAAGPGHDRALPEGAIASFVEQLLRLGLLEGEAPPERRRFDLFSIRLRALDPDRFLSRTLPAVRPLFSRPALLLCLATTLAALAVATVALLAHGRLPLPPLSEVLRLHSLPWLWLAGSLVITAHELAHAYACKQLGGQVHEIGFLLLYFQPCFYCDVSDAWMFERRAQRLWVSAAGLIVELFLWAVATLLWVLLPEGSALRAAAGLVGVFCGLKTLLVNLNPLIKLDGYYLLSDFLELPNLRERAFAYLAYLTSVARLTRGRGRRTTPASPAATAPRYRLRERFVLVAYAILSPTYVVAILTFSTLAIGDFLLGRLGPLWGGLLTAALALLVLHRMLRGGIMGRRRAHAR